MVKEVDVAKPIENFLEELGYLVRSEVKGCDITAIKGNDLIIVECKTSVSLKLIYQCVDRQEFSDNVYLGIPLVDGKSIPNRKYLFKLLKRLELGLITVTFQKNRTKVNIILEPNEYKSKKKVKYRKKIIEEINNRSENLNIGGSYRSKLMTAYKEASLEIGKYLKNKGSLSAKELQKLGTPSKTYSILYKNYYGWFFKDTGRGKYGLTQKGLQAINDFYLLSK